MIKNKFKLIIRAGVFVLIVLAIFFLVNYFLGKTPRNTLKIINNTKYILAETELKDYYGNLLANLDKLQPKESYTYEINSEGQIWLDFIGNEKEKLSFLVFDYAFVGTNGKVVEIVYYNDKFSIK